MRGIQFDALSIKGLLSGLKTQSRRKINLEWNQPNDLFFDVNRQYTPEEMLNRSRYKVGDYVYVKEAWQTLQFYDGLRPVEISEKLGGDCIAVKYADGTTKNWIGGDKPGRKRQSLHMPQWASRIILRITDVRIQPLREMSEADSAADLGVPLVWPGPGPEPYKRNLKFSFYTRWQDMYRPLPFNEDEPVFVYTFEKQDDQNKP